jgi:hypothetical protein
MSDTYVDRLRRGYEALNRGDVSVVLELLDPDIEAPTGAHRGRASQRCSKSTLALEALMDDPHSEVPGSRVVAGVQRLRLIADGGDGALHGPRRQRAAGRLGPAEEPSNGQDPARPSRQN